MPIIHYALRYNDRPSNYWITNLQEGGTANSRRVTESYRRVQGSKL